MTDDPTSSSRRQGLPCHAAATCRLEQTLDEQSRLLQTTLTSISQGILVYDAELRVQLFNPPACALLNLPAELLATRPTLQALHALQLARGDYGPDMERVDPHARDYMRSAGQGLAPPHFLRVTPDGRTLEVKTQSLPNGGTVRTLTDVTDYAQAEAARARLDLLLEATQSLALVGGWEVDFTQDRVLWTSGIYRLLEIDPATDDFHPTTLASVSRFTRPASMALLTAAYADRASQPAGHDLELEMVTARGRGIWVRSKGTAIWAQGRMLTRTSVLQDITERKLAETVLQDHEQRWKLALESAGDGLWDWDLQTGTEYCSPQLKAMYGYGPDTPLDRADQLDRLVHPDDMAQLWKDRQSHFDGRTRTYVNEHRMRCADGRWKWVLSRGMAISRNSHGQPLRMIGTHTDITERKKAETLIWQQAHFDALTGLPNRIMLHDRLAQEIKRSRREGLQLAVLFIDLDHFKEVNDTLGHGCGDQLLVEAARRIQGCLRATDTVARMGGDEFTVLLTDLNDASNTARILQHLLQALEQVFQLGNEQVFISASIGIAIYPLDATEVEDLFKNADQALYVAKGAGRRRYSFFTPALQEAAQTRVRLANDLRTGLLQQQFQLVYQPIVELASGAIHKAEALLRWQHPSHGLVSPADFIPVAEATGLIVDIGEWVFQQAARQVRQWRATLDPDFQISVNRSPMQFQHHGNAHLPWATQLQAMGLPGQSLAVEITEGLLLDTSSNVAAQLLDLRDAGIQVSLDDFGTGYSSLSYLQKFDIDFIKIDQSFVRQLAPVGTNLALCQAIIVMAHALGIRVIAEGVENTQQRDLLAAAGCDYAQGYLFAWPMSAPELEAMVAAHPSHPARVPAALR